MRFSYLVFSLIFSIEVFSQTRLVSVDFMSMDINSNVRSGGMADIGTVSSVFYPDAGISQNPALLTTKQRYAGLNLTNLFMLKKISENVNLSNINYYYAIDNKNVLAYSISGYSLGRIDLMDELGYLINTIEPYELHHKFSYAREITKNSSIGINAKIAVGDMGLESNSLSVAFDLGYSFRKNYFLSNLYDLKTNFGVAINNLGPKVTYDEGQYYNFIPTNLKLGALLNPELKATEKFTLNLELALQIEKYLVPSLPLYKTYPGSEIIKGYDPNVSEIKALYQSFYDSPEGFKGELKEIQLKMGTELRANYSDILYLALRLGRYNEVSMQSGNYLTTLGVGLGLFGFSLDFNYLKPDLATNPNENFGLSLGYRINLDKKPFRF